MDIGPPATPQAAAPDIQITGAIAHEMHWGARSIDDLWVWSVTANVRDYPGLYCARPGSTKRNVILPFVLLAGTLDGVRDQLPLGLVRMDRHEGDDPVVIEAWL